VRDGAAEARLRGRRKFAVRVDAPARALALGVQQRAVGARDQLPGGPAGLPFRDARRRAAARDIVEVAQCGGEALERAGGYLGGPVLVGVDRDERELVAAVAGGEIVGAGGGAQRVTDAAQDLVTDQVAVLVVDCLEIVEVDQDQRQRTRIGARGAFDLPPEAVVQGRRG
jgi:hypothetical protein